MKFGKVIKKIFIFIGVIISLLIISAVLIPVFFKGKILNIVKTELNKQLNATTNFSDVDISIFRNFPNLSVSILDLSIVGKDNFNKDTLISSKSINVAVDIMKAINGQYEILNIGLNSPRIHAIVLPNGKANWDITKPTPTTAASTQSTPFSMKLKKYGIENGFIDYDDEQGKMHITIENLNHKGHGDFSSTSFTLETKTTADAISYFSGSIPYMKKVKTTVDLDLAIDNTTHKYSFNTDKIQLNGLKLSAKGFVQMPDTINMKMDIAFSTPSNDFKDILSLVPGVYQADFKDLKTAGKINLNGNVKGTYNKTQMPSFALNINVVDAMFQYPALPQKLSDIQIKLAVINPDGVPDHTVINLEKLHVKLGEEPFDLRLLLKTPLSNQWVDAAMKGHINLANLQQFIKLEQGTKLSGSVDADITVKGSIAEAQKQHFDQLDAKGKIDIKNINYSSKDLPDGVNIISLLLSFNPKNVSVTDFKGKYVTTNFVADGSVDNLLGYCLHNETLKGKFNFTADKMDCNKLMGTSATPATTTNAATTQPFIVPDNLDIEAHASVTNVKYDNIEITNLHGGLIIRNQTVSLQDAGGNAFDGTLKISGSYSTKVDRRNPDIQFDYNFTNVDIQKTYNSFPTAQKMMPVGKYASGKFSSQFNMTGKLKNDMTPNINSLSGKGNIMLLNCFMSNFPVSDKLVDELKLTEFKTLSMKDTKIFFSFENGRVTVQPFKQKIGAIDAEISGSHGFDQTINYTANMAMPMSMLGGQANNEINSLVNQLKSKGIPAKLGDKVNFTVKITGTVTSPKIETDYKNIAQNTVNNLKNELTKQISKKVDSVKTVVKDTLKAVTKQATNQAKDEIKKQITGESKKKPEDAVKDAADKAKDNLKGFFNKKK